MRLLPRNTSLLVAAKLAARQRLPSKRVIGAALLLGRSQDIVPRNEGTMSEEGSTAIAIAIAAIKLAMAIASSVNCPRYEDSEGYGDRTSC